MVNYWMTKANETIPERISNCCIDKNGNVWHVKKYFTDDARSSYTLYQTKQWLRFGQKLD